MTLPPENPATCAVSTPRPRSTAAASSAIVATENGASGSGVRPTPRLS